MTLIINEVAWAGTNASEGHEWIELYNPGASPINLSDGWRLESSDGTPNIDFSSALCTIPGCTIPAGGYFLLERDTDGVISTISADLIYAGALSNSGETLSLYSPANELIDTANGNGGAWPAGSASTRSTMERIGMLPDGDTAWFTNDGVMRTGLDYNEDPIWGTPRNGNSLTPTPSPTNTSTPTPTITTTPPGVRSVIINEIAWAGTASGLPDDEWIELYNPGTVPISITGWNLRAVDGTPNIVLNGTIPAGGYFLLERGSNLGDDTTVSDIPADQIYTGNALSNTGEALTLYDGANRVIDTANGNGGAWPAGSATTYGTMERITGTVDSDTAWHTNTGVKRNGLNANGGNILGTPRNSNSIGPTPTPSSTRTSTPTSTPAFVIDPRPIINEILARPGFDWNQNGRVDVFDEFIEIKNLSPIDINLSGWKLDLLDGGSFSLPNVSLKPGERVVFYGSQTNLLLSDGGATIRLYNPSGRIYDAYTYSFAREADRSFCRLPDGNVFGKWFEDCTPTPNLANSRAGVVPSMPGGGYESPVCELPDTIPAAFLLAECRGYGANIWNSFYWDQPGWHVLFFRQNTSKWEAFIE
ncbi:MAG: lamin tail domain-containing protein [Anaerolineales bacterium]|nr:MAG: lamin tail domain-containing protein [Anaerolineales bacterium]